MITQKTKYALKALAVLTDEHDGAQRPLQIEEIARRSGAPKRFLEHILLDIRNTGILRSIRGRNGGYLLARDPAQVSLSDVLRRVDGPLAPLPCLSRQSYQRCEDCRDEESCRIRRLFAEIFWSYLLLLDSLTLADLRQGAVPEALADLAAAGDAATRPEDGAVPDAAVPVRAGVVRAGA